MRLPPYKSVTDCAKCGLDFGQTRPLSTRYGVAQDHVDVSGKTVLLDDYLLRECPRCLYEWKEACVDDKS